ncbi:PREDICTED: G-box-binding factor 2 isoform X2 [Tarenaya hassleriana]|uniref:G-box-binding factor 2 isoform X2 n=1 Tax=Tarenaya hassleriana TaxID=28532 RepID=UPI00053C132E|nr:PREDICTED: G-box-binding factor 2 isoform X2 [Tarenaya hassleriana]
MGSNEEGKSSKSEKSSPSAPEQSNVHVYPDWGAMQAYYGPRVVIPPYYNSTVAPGHAPPPYIWAPPSPMMAPYGAPYPAFCPPGGVYAHPGIPMTQGPTVQASPAPAATAPLSMDTPKKTPGNTDQGFMKKLKEFDGLAMSVGNDKVERSEQDEPRTSQSSENEGSSNGSYSNTTGGEQSKRKRSLEGTSAMDGGPPTQVNPLSTRESMNGKPTATMVRPVMHTSLELQGSSGMNGAIQPCTVIPPEEKKRERRKQSNRESARRSRLRKQAEAEELARKVDSLATENMTLRSELNLLNEKSEKLRLEKEELLEKLGAAEGRGKTENLISRVENNEGGGSGGETTYEKTSKKVKHQLVDLSHPVAAS